MKKINFVLAVLILKAFPHKNYYTAHGNIISINNRAETVSILDENKKIWTIPDTEGWMINDNCELLIRNEKIVSCVFIG